MGGYKVRVSLYLYILDVYVSLISHAKA